MADDGGSSSWSVDGTTDPDEVAKRYDDWATGYDADLESWSYAAPEVVAGIVLTEVPEVTSVLDAACGTGLVGKALRTAAAVLTPADSSTTGRRRRTPPSPPG